MLAGRSRGSDAARDQVEELARSGVRIQVIAADVSTRAGVLRIMDGLSGMPQLKGIVHAAGVLADGVLSRQDMAQFQKVLSPKVLGAWNLHEATMDMNLDFFVCYSSAASVLGSAGQSGYAAANAFLDGFAHERRRMGLHGLSINWGPWELGMAAGMESRDAERITAQGFKPIQVSGGFRALEGLLLQDRTQALVLPMDWDNYLRYRYHGAIPSFFQAILGESSGKQGMTGARSAILLKLEAAPAAQRYPILLEYVKTQAAAVLGEIAGRWDQTQAAAF